MKTLSSIVLILALDFVTCNCQGQTPNTATNNHLSATNLGVQRNVELCQDLSCEWVSRKLSAIANASAGFWSNTSGQFISALAGALLGAIAAYRFQNRREKRHCDEKQRTAIICAQLTLMTQLNGLENLRNRVLEPLRNVQNRELKIPISIQPPADLSIDIASLAFLVDKHDANLIRDVYLAERSHFTTFRALAIRNDLFGKLHEASRVIDVNPTTGKATLDPEPLTLKLLKDATNALYDNIDDAIIQITRVVDALRRTGIELFPGHKFLAYESYHKTSEKMQRT
jgi:hypothetical protein